MRPHSYKHFGKVVDTPIVSLRFEKCPLINAIRKIVKKMNIRASKLKLGDPHVYFWEKRKVERAIMLPTPAAFNT